MGPNFAPQQTAATDGAAGRHAALALVAQHVESVAAGQRRRKQQQQQQQW